MTIKKISVFCGAHLGKSPDYKIAAQQIGKAMAEKGLEVIFGAVSYTHLTLPTILRV